MGPIRAFRAAASGNDGGMKNSFPFRFPFLIAMTALCLGTAARGADRDEDMRLVEAKRWSDKGEFDKAVQELRMYLNEHPDATDIYARIGGLRFKQGNYKLAGENFKLALAKHPDLVDARQGLAEAYEKTGEKAKAAETWRQVAETSKDPAKKKAAALRSKELSHQAQSDAPGAHEGATSGSSNKPVTLGDGASASTSTSLSPSPSSSSSSSDSPFSPAMDSSAAKPAQGIYADKDFQDALRSYRDKHPEAAQASLRKCLSKNPNHPGAFYLGGVIRYEHGELGKAAYNFKRSVDYPDRGYNAFFYLGRIYQKQERISEAVKSYEKYLPLTKSETGKRQVEGYLAQLRGPGESVKNQADTKKNPLQAKSQEKGGQKSAVKGVENPEAKAGKPEVGPEGGEIVDGGETDSVSTKAKKIKATGLEEMNAAARAVKPEGPAQVLGQNGTFFFLTPDAGAASGKILSEAYELCRKEKFEKAITKLQETAMTYGGTDNARAAKLDLASIDLRLGLWKNALEQIADFTTGKDSSKFSDAASYLSAMAHLGLKDGESAEKALLKIKPGSAYAPTQEEVDFRLAQTGELLKDSKKWSTYLETALASAKDPLRKAQSAQQLGYLHAKYGNSDKAAEYFKRSMVECRDSALAALCAESQLRLGDMAYRKKDWKGAMGQYRIFAGKYPNHKESAWVHYQMANIYKATNNFESALNEYKRVIDNYPDSYWASQAKWKREDTIWQKEYEEVLD